VDEIRYEDLSQPHYEDLVKIGHLGVHVCSDSFANICSFYMSADRSVMGVVLESLESFSIRCHACIFEWAAILTQFVLHASVSNILLPIAAFVLIICCCWLLCAVLIMILDPGQKFREIPLTDFGIPLIHAILYGAPKKQRDNPA